MKRLLKPLAKRKTATKELRAITVEEKRAKGEITTLIMAPYIPHLLHLDKIG